ncbi:hypothetical protein [Dactylosporangium sp. NPDC048998]|uniref:hypothetical protein n=1 Tax=Dactylosporangium sp. NPDC048998 TaxID=3363976 RepID=UPI00371FD56E
MEHTQSTATTCTATKSTLTATGDLLVHCTKPAGHVAGGDPRHEAKVGAFPVRWTDQPTTTPHVGPDAGPAVPPLR